MEVSGYIHAMVTTGGELDSSSHWIGGCFAPGAGLDVLEKGKSLTSAGNRIPDVKPIAPINWLWLITRYLVFIWEIVYIKRFGF